MSERSLEFLIPGDLEAATGGYGYDRRMIAGLRELGWQVAVHQLDASFPQPSIGALEQARERLAHLPEGALVLVDGLAAGAMPQVLRPQAARLRMLALVHHPLAAESGLAADRAQELVRSERLALEAMRHVIVTSAATQRALEAYGVGPDRVSVVEPGTDAAPLAQGERGDTVRMLCVGALIPRKGHDLLFDALARLATDRWTLVCAGSAMRDPDTAARLHRQLQRLGLSRRVRLDGEVDAGTLERLYRESDLFVLPARVEGYGMAVAEALAHGLPVIGTDVGAVAQLVGERAGLLVQPDDVGQLHAALARVLTEPALRVRLAAGAAQVRSTLPGWPRSCRRMSGVLETAGAATAPAGSP
jgi:glycosyltransferase involved in cell wall biosynthesis